MVKPVQLREKQGKAQVEIKADEEKLFGVYSTLAQIAHTPEEFMLDFLHIVPNSELGKLMARVIVSPGHAKRLLKALGKNIRKYEENFGTIQEPQQPEPEIGFVQ